MSLATPGMRPSSYLIPDSSLTDGLIDTIGGKHLRRALLFWWRGPRMRYSQMRYSQWGERGMIRFAAAAIILTVFTGSCVFAQDATPKVEVFGGYSLLHADHGGLTGPLLDADLNQPSNPFAVPTYFLNGWS